MGAAQDAELLGLLDGIGYRPARAFGGSGKALIGRWPHRASNDEKYVFGRPADLSSAKSIENGCLNSFGHWRFSVAPTI